MHIALLGRWHDSYSNSLCNLIVSQSKSRKLKSSIFYSRIHQICYCISVPMSDGFLMFSMFFVFQPQYCRWVYDSPDWGTLQKFCPDVSCHHLSHYKERSANHRVEFTKSSGHAFLMTPHRCLEHERHGVRELGSAVRWARRTIAVSLSKTTAAWPGMTSQWFSTASRSLHQGPEAASLGLIWWMGVLKLWLISTSPCEKCQAWRQ